MHPEQAPGAPPGGHQKPAARPSFSPRTYAFTPQPATPAHGTRSERITPQIRETLFGGTRAISSTDHFGQRGCQLTGITHLCPPYSLSLLSYTDSPRCPNPTCRPPTYPRHRLPWYQDAIKWQFLKDGIKWQVVKDAIKLQVVKDATKLQFVKDAIKLAGCQRCNQVAGCQNAKLAKTFLLRVHNRFQEQRAQSSIAARLENIVR
mmetsp:Transcript_9371/g.20467  ORF Transcript_9371/g.20467 Transcript_9371/m.20467 type:complete len:205 (+) Transcript_9371:3156-3770(+)